MRRYPFDLSPRKLHGEPTLPEVWTQAIFHPRWSGGRVAEGTGLL